MFSCSFSTGGRNDTPIIYFCDMYISSYAQVLHFVGLRVYQCVREGEGGGRRNSVI